MKKGDLVVYGDFGGRGHNELTVGQVYVVVDREGSLRPGPDLIKIEGVDGDAWYHSHHFTLLDANTLKGEIDALHVERLKSTNQLNLKEDQLRQVLEAAVLAPMTFVHEGVCSSRIDSGIGVTCDTGYLIVKEDSSGDTENLRQFIGRDVVITQTIEVKR